MEALIIGLVLIEQERRKERAHRVLNPKDRKR